MRENLLKTLKLACKNYQEFPYSFNSLENVNTHAALFYVQCGRGWPGSALNSLRGGGVSAVEMCTNDIRENQFPQSTLNGDLIPGHKDGDNGPFCIYITPYWGAVSYFFFKKSYTLNGDRSRVTSTYRHLFSINTWKETVL